MSAREGESLSIRPWIVAGITLVHAAVFAAILHFSIPARSGSAPSSINIDFAVLEPEATLEPEIEPEPEIEVDSHRDVNVEIDILASPPSSARSAPEVLTRRDTFDVEPSNPVSSRDEQTDTIGTDQIAAAMRRAACQTLTQRRETECEPPNPFDQAEAVSSREDSQRAPILIAVFDQQNATERFFSRQNRQRHMFPGMDADLFAAPSAPGAADAARIRSGQAPRWSDEKKRGFTAPQD